jgi:hypothetical protein
MHLTWLPNTTLGYMVGDYISTSFVNGKAFGVFAVAQANVGSKFSEAMYTTSTGLSVEETGLLSSEGEQPVPDAKSDHGPRQEQGERGRKIPPSKKLLKRVAH